MKTRLLALCALSLAAVGTADAQVTLPLRLDLESTGPSDLPTGYTSLAPSDIYSPGTTLYGWDTATTGFAVSPAGVDDRWLPKFTDSAADIAEHADLVKVLRDGHRFGGTAESDQDRRFGVELSGNTEYRVRVDVGILHHDTGWSEQPLTGMRGIRIYIGDSMDEDDLVTLEENAKPDNTTATWTGAWPRTLGAKANLAPSHPFYNGGGYRTYWFNATTPGSGLLTLRFDSSDGLGVAVQAIEIFEYSEAPITFVPGNMSTSPGLEVNSSYSLSGADATNLGDGIDELLANDVAGAETEFDLVTDDLARATGLLWAAGWLDDEEVGYDAGLEWTLLLEAIGILEGLSSSDARVVEYLQMARECRKAYKHWRLRGYWNPVSFTDETFTTTSPFSGENDALLLSLNAAEALGRNVGSQQLSAVLGNRHMEVHPLFFRGLLLTGLNWASRTFHNKFLAEDPGVPTQPTGSNSSYVFNKQFNDLFKELNARDYHTDLFSESAELAVMNHVATYDGPDANSVPDYDQDIWGSIIFHWGLEGVSAVENLGSTRWWLSWLADANSVTPSGSTDWAGWQWRARQGVVAAQEWWLERRFIDGEYGGGGGDDVEFLLLQLAPTLPISNNEVVLEDAAREVIDDSLALWDPDVNPGTEYYFEPSGGGDAADVEHTGEYTSNPLWVGLQHFYGEPYYLEYAMQSAKHMDTGVAAESWTALLPTSFTPSTVHHYPDGTSNELDLRRFVAWHMDARGPDTMVAGSDKSGDVPRNGRAVLGSFYVRAYNGDPTISEWLRECAEWWWNVAMDDGSLTTTGTIAAGQAKPVGVLPGVVDFNTSTGLLEYGDPDATTPVWWEGGYGFKTELHYVYGGFLLERYLDPETDASERSDYLLPIYLASQLVAEYWRVENLGTHSIPQITTLDGSVSTPGTEHWTAKELFESGVLRDSILQSFPYMRDDPDLQMLSEHGDQMDALELYLLDEGGSFAALSLTGDLTDVIDGYVQAFDWVDAFFPIGTNHVAYTDRAIFSARGTRYNAFSSSTGGAPSSLPGYLITWERPLADFTDVANGADPGPEGDPLQVSVIALPVEVIDFGGAIGEQPRFTALLANLEDSPGGGVTERPITARFWYRLPAGNYTIEYGPNDGSDDISTVTSPSGLEFTLDRPGSSVTFEVPYADTGGDDLVIQFTRTNDTVTPLVTGPDLAMAPRDVELTMTGSKPNLHFTVHNVGNDDATNASFWWWFRIPPATTWTQGQTVQTISVDAPDALDPETHVHTWNGSNDVGSNLTVEILTFVLPQEVDLNPDNNWTFQSVTTP